MTPLQMVWLVGLGGTGLYVLFLLLRTRSQLSALQVEHQLLQQSLTEHLRQTSERDAYRAALYKIVGDAVIYLDDAQRVMVANDPAVKIFGPVKPQTPLSDWIPYPHLTEIAQQAAGVSGHIAHQFHHDDRVYQLRAIAVVLDDCVLGVALSLNDVSELQRLGRARRDFVANISHDLRTPISAIRLLAETLQKGALEKPTLGYDMVNKILTELQTLDQTNQELMDLSMIESGQVFLKLVSLNLTKRVRREVKRFKPLAETKGLAVNLTMEKKVRVLADKQLLSRVLSNLIHNALKFTTTGHIEIGAEAVEDDMTKVWVADTGEGILPEAQKRVFERFFIGNDARTREGRTRAGSTGTGLGLAIARHIVEAHGGNIWLESEVGLGTTVFFTLPSESLLDRFQDDDDDDDNDEVNDNSD